MMTRKEMPGNPRYQPVSLVPYFGYDNLAKFQIEVEWALLEALAEIEIIPKEEAISLTDNLKRLLMKEITTTSQDKREKDVTKHDIRALVQLMQELMPTHLKKWVHFSATSYDIIENARIIAYQRAFYNVTFPTILDLIENLSKKAEEFSAEIQIGRTHGQHALPITVGFWLATVLDRLLNTAEELKKREERLVGKFSGAVGSYNAQVGLNLDSKALEFCNHTFEELVLSKLNLKPSNISTQILPIEPLSRFLHEHVLLSGVLAQFARDCRHLQRTEIAEIAEEFQSKQVGSSTMAHKRNPITFENTEGLFKIVMIEYQKVLECLVSDHQRDLVGSSIMREFPGIVVLVQYQIERINKILPKLSIVQKSLRQNFNQSSKLVLAEPLYLILQLFGYNGDAHELVNHILVPRTQKSGRHLIDELIEIAEKDKELAEIISKIPYDMMVLLRTPEKYIGKSQEKTLKVVKRAREFVKTNS
jgi:adenylosuccinate lyase